MYLRIRDVFLLQRDMFCFHWNARFPWPDRPSILQILAFRHNLEMGEISASDKSAIEFTFTDSRFNENCFIRFGS